MFANRGKMTKKDMQANMRAMLAKTKVADSVVGRGQSSQNNSQSAYQPRKNFQPTKTKPASTNKSTTKRLPSRQNDGGEKRQVVVNSQKSIYKPNLKRADSQSGISSGSKPPTTSKTPATTGSKDC